MPERKTKTRSTGHASKKNPGIYIDGAVVLKNRPDTTRNKSKKQGAKPQASSSKVVPISTAKSKNEKANVKKSPKTKTNNTTSSNSPQKRSSHTSKNKKKKIENDQHKKARTQKRIKSRIQKTRNKKRREQEIYDSFYDEATNPVVRYNPNNMGAIQVVFLCVICVMCVLACTYYSKLKFIYLEQEKTIASVNRKVTDLQTDNEAYHKKVLTSVTLDEILEYAIDEIGMHYPKKDEIKYYDADEVTYVRQYTDVPKPE